MKIIRCPKMNDENVYVKYPWKKSDYIEFADHIDPEFAGFDSKLDAALGDRLMWWNTGYNVAKYYNFNCRLQFLDKDLPEHVIFKFPHTEIVSSEEFYDGINDFEYVDDYVHAHITGDVPDFPINAWKDLEPPNNCIVPYYHIQYHGPGYDDETYSKIEFVYPELEERLAEFFSKFNVVHVRRWTGIRYIDESDFDELGEEKKRTYMQDAPFLEKVDENSLTPWMYYKDSHYFNALKDVDGPIYIATDLPNKYYLDAWKEEYGERLYCQQFIDREVKSMFADYYSHEWMMEHAHSYQGVMDRLVDYFALVFAGHLHIVKTPKYPMFSSYSDTARHLRNAPCTIHEVEL